MSESILALGSSLKWVWGVVFVPTIWYIVKRNDKRHEDLEKKIMDNQQSYTAHCIDSAEKFGAVTESVRGIHEAMGEIKGGMRDIQADIKELIKKK